MVRILIADDHAVVRAGLRQFLEGDPKIKLMGEAATGSETLDQLRAKEWDLVLLDIFMPDRSGLDILRHIHIGYPKVKVLVLDNNGYGTERPMLDGCFNDVHAWAVSRLPEVIADGAYYGNTVRFIGWGVSP